MGNLPVSLSAYRTQGEGKKKCGENLRPRWADPRAENPNLNRAVHRNHHGGVETVHAIPFRNSQGLGRGRRSF